MRAISTGGGMMEVVNVDGFTVSMFGDCFETLLWVRHEGNKLAQELAKRHPPMPSLCMKPPAINWWR